MSSKSFITTPIYYVNASPHLGHAHTSVMADILKRIRKNADFDVVLSTGTDEHGQKNQEAAKSLGMPINEYLESRSKEFQTLFDLLDVDYDVFVRTSDLGYKARVTEVLNRLWRTNQIVKKRYSGIYCPGCEQFKTENDLDAKGQCADHPSTTLESIDEENYFLVLETYRAELIDLIKTKQFVKSPRYKNELLSMLEQPLDDLSISRPKSRVSLGVELPFDTDFVAYVWVDALTNYLTNIGWPNAGYLEWWLKSEHLIGKDILKTHGIYWPIILLALGLEPPKTLSVHAHWTGKGGIKMSKSLGNVVNPFEVVEKLGVDALRYFLAKNMRIDADCQISIDLIQSTYNSDLVNKIGNLLSRSAKLAIVNFNGVVPSPSFLSESDEELRQEVLESVKPFFTYIELDDIPRLVDNVIKSVDRLNEYFANNEAWKLLKDHATRERAATVIYVTLDCVSLVLKALHAIMPESTSKALSWFEFLESETDVALDKLIPESNIQPVTSLFPRIP